MIDRFKPSLLKCFSLVASIRANPEDRETCYALQEYLVSKITYIERKLKNAKNAIKELKSALATERAFSRDKAQLLKEYIRYLNYKIDVYQNVLHIYRDVGDAIAYTYVDRWDLKPTSFKEGPGFISAKRGARLERAIFRRTRSQLRPGIIMILNDVTNCLRYGDLTLVGDGRILRIIEAKSGKSKKFNKRGKRQQEKN